ncbi:KH domain-containing protein HEN4 [Abrus precatorius]|uniref:KH domain-containing protein HEN4 n=1 Tax=Abrus precatorius TaxID=3816 RepID=A0A8B8KLL1_ABRPR|nr:KH domain-containing protein HEN4 [Abrus precatorius]
MSNNNGKKRRHVPPAPSDTIFRILCPAANTADITALAGDGAKILVDDFGGADERVVVIVGAAEQPVSCEESPAQVALIRVFEKMVDEESKASNSAVSCRLVAPSYQVGSVLGRGGKIVEKIRQESGAQVRVLPKDQIPHPPPGDELIQITGNFASVKKALVSVSSCIQDNVRVDAANSGGFRPSGPGGHHGPPPPAQVEPYSQRGYAPSGSYAPPDHHPRGYSSFPGPEGAGPGPAHRMFAEEEVVFKLLCHHDKVGSLIGKGGSVVRALQNETGASIQIVEAGPDSDERVVVISARENSEQKHSPAQEAVIRVHGRLTEIGFEPSAAVVAKLLVRSPQVGCLLGKGGLVISEMRRATGASIRIFSKEQIKYISQNEEVVQVIGSLQSVQDALFHITSRIRETIFPVRTPPNFSAPPHLPPFPEMPPPLFRPRNHLMSSGHPPPPVGPPHGIDHSTVPPMPVDHQHAFLHGMGRGPPNMDRVPYPRGYEGPNSPRSWNPLAVNRGNPGGTGDNSSLASRNGTPGKNGNPLQNPNSLTIEITIPYTYLNHVYGENNSNLTQIRQTSGANVVVHDPKPGAAEGLVIVSGAPDQTHAAQCLIQAFILCGQTVA